MKFREVCDLLAVEIRPDGDIPYPFPNQDDARYQQAFGIRVAQILRQFTADTRHLFVNQEPLVVAAGDRIVDLSDPVKCDKSIIEATSVWLNNQKLTKVEAGDILRSSHPTDPAGIPLSWGQLSDTEIIFSVELEESLANSFVSGFYRHPEIEGDDDRVLVPEEHVQTLIDYASVFLRRPVASDQVGIERLAMLRADTREGIKRMRGRALSRVTGGR